VLSEDSSSSMEADASDGSTSASDHKEITSNSLGRPVKSPRLEESDAKSDGCPPLRVLGVPHHQSCLREPKMMRWRVLPKVSCA
jgi:hypothetical protein